jgi:hypothetical protein
VKIDSTRIATAGAVGLPVTILLVASAPPAFAETEGGIINDAVANLNSGTSYVSSDAEASDLSIYDGSSVGVVVVSERDLGPFQVSNIAGPIYDQVKDDYETVIVVNSDAQSGMSAYAVAPNDLSSPVREIIGSGESGQELIAGLPADSGDLIALTSTSADVPASGGGEGFDAAPIVFGGGGLILGVAAVVAVTRFVSKHNKNRVRAITTQSIKDREFRQSMERFGELTRIHANEQFPTSAPMRSILTHLNNLFARLEKKGVGNAKQMAEVNYKGILQKLNETLGEDYYIDISKNPKLWDRASQRTSEVEKALFAVDDQVLENIKQVNASKDLDFRVALETILSSADRPNASDMIR